MLPSLLLPLLASTPAPPAAAPAPAPVLRSDLVEGFEERLEAAGDDVDALLEVAAWAKEQRMRKQARSTWERVVELDPENADARAGLGHEKYNGKWFESASKLKKYKRKHEKEMLEEHGKVLVDGEWVSADEGLRLKLGWRRGEEGRWLTSFEAFQADLAAAMEAEGAVMQADMTWVPAEEASKLDEGLWKCGDRWLSKEAANAYHSKIETWWSLPSPTNRFVLFSTCDHDTVVEASRLAEAAYSQVRRVFGVEPDHRLTVVLFNNTEQYNRFAGGDFEAEPPLPPTESGGFSGSHHAYFADTWFRPRMVIATKDESGKMVAPPGPRDEFPAAGVGYWDKSDPAVAPFGAHSVRHAAALAYVDSIDPSWDTISKLLTEKRPRVKVSDFYEEKRLPAWLRYGAAVYAERFFPVSGGDRWQMRNWTVSNMSGLGALEPMDDVFRFDTSPEAGEDLGLLLKEAGLLVAYMLDGESGPVTAAHGRLKETLRSGTRKDVEAATKALEEALSAEADVLRTWAGL
jgi:hypothetical protein